MNKFIIVFVLLLVFTVNNCKQKQDKSKVDQTNTDTTEVSKDSTEYFE